MYRQQAQQMVQTGLPALDSPPGHGREVLVWCERMWASDLFVALESMQWTIGFADLDGSPDRLSQWLDHTRFNNSTSIGLLVRAAQVSDSLERMFDAAARGEDLPGAIMFIGYDADGMQFLRNTKVNPEEIPPLLIAMSTADSCVSEASSLCRELRRHGIDIRMELFGGTQDRLRLEQDKEFLNELVKFLDDNLERAFPKFF